MITLTDIVRKLGGRGLPRSLCLAIFAVAFTGGSVAQEVTNPRTLDELFVKLGQLQDANLGIARQIAETQRQAAAMVQGSLDEGAISDPGHRRIAEAFVANALTLASVVLAPVATQEIAAAEVLTQLLRKNLVLLQAGEPMFRQAPEFAAVMKRYTVLQMQTEDLLVALHRSWSRYGETLTTAEVAGMLRPGSFDASGRNWSLVTPEFDMAAPPTTELEFQTGTNAAEVYGEVGIGAAAPAAEVSASQPAPAPIQPEVPPENRLPALGALTVAGSSNPADQSDAWVTAVNDAGRATATAPNTNAETSGRISSLQIGCHPSGTLQYVFDAPDEAPEYRVYANDTEEVALRAEANTISGGEALRMSDILRLAFEWATRDPAHDGSIVITPGSETAVRATFPVAGYLEARGRVLDTCVPWEPAGVSVDAKALAPPESPAASRKGSEDRIAPVPHPRPKGRTPVDIMSGG